MTDTKEQIAAAIVRTRELTDILCANCGLCCDGSLFDDVELSGEAEATKLEVMDLEIDTDDHPLLLQPCTALNGTRCRIYNYRPGCCRTFECLLLQNARDGTVSIDQAEATITRTREHVARMKKLCAALDKTKNNFPLKEKCIEALSRPADCDDDAANRQRAELAGAMDTMAAIVREHFLG